MCRRNGCDRDKIDSDRAALVLPCISRLYFDGLTFSSDCRDPKLIFSLLLVFGARAKYLLNFLVSKMNNLKVQVQHGLVIGRTVSKIRCQIYKKYILVSFECIVRYFFEAFE